MTLPNEIRAIVVEDAHLGCHRSARQQWWAVKDSNLGPDCISRARAQSAHDHVVNGGRVLEYNQVSMVLRELKS